MPTVRETVAEIYEKKSREPQEDFANSLRLLINGVLGGDTFSNELLQNADDALQRRIDRESRTVQFTLTENFLM